METMEQEVQMASGFFTMDVIRAVCNERDIIAAKKIATDAVENYDSHKAQKQNVVKAMNMIEKAKTVKDLGISLANFMLAHPSENLKSIR
jgi:hypothetical protein